MVGSPTAFDLSSSQLTYLDFSRTKRVECIAPQDETIRAGLTSTVRRVRTALAASYSEHAVVTVDVGWLPGVDGRFYDFAGLAAAADYTGIEK